MTFKSSEGPSNVPVDLPGLPSGTLQAYPLTPWEPVLVSPPLDPMGPCRPTSYLLGPFRPTPWPPRTLKVHPLKPPYPFHLAELYRSIWSCWVSFGVGRKFGSLLNICPICNFLVLLGISAPPFNPTTTITTTTSVPACFNTRFVCALHYTHIYTSLIIHNHKQRQRQKGRKGREEGGSKNIRKGVRYPFSIPLIPFIFFSVPYSSSCVIGLDINSLNGNSYPAPKIDYLCANIGEIVWLWNWSLNKVVEWVKTHNAWVCCAFGNE